MPNEAYSGKTDVTYAPSCDEIATFLVPTERKIRKGGVETIVAGFPVGQNGGLAFPSNYNDKGTVETFRDFVRQLTAEGLAELVESNVFRPAGATGTHSYLIREPITGTDTGQYVRLDLNVSREEGKGKLRYEATIEHSCKPGERLKASNGTEIDSDLWVELSSVFLG
ncbi:hypothetical protein J4207_06530 [Candidatus Woesearchaeota archaeon]|nr:hypothetical protein [Candidatus Woesearchaeota archaeon]